MTRRLGRLAMLLAAALICTAARADFIQVDTSFGAGTALRDNATGLSWLHSVLTTNMSYNDMVGARQPGGAFYGWRYATPGEVTTLFSDYTGVPGGVVFGNGELALRFMDDLGGPTAVTVFNVPPYVGDVRHAIYGGLLDVPFDLGHAEYGLIMTDDAFGSRITPQLQGSAVDSFAFYDLSHWLVRDDSPAPVPEPGSFAMLAGGLSLIGMLRYKGR